MNPGAKTKGFTLLELLVAVSVGLVLAGVMLAITVGTLELWRRTQDNFTTATQARLVLDFLERDLQAAIRRDDGRTWLAVDIHTAPSSLTNRGWLTAGAIKPADLTSQRYLPVGEESALAEARFGLSGAWLRFITTNVEAGGSLPTAVSYQIARRPVSGVITANSQGAVRYSLFRAAVTPAQTFALGYDVLTAGYGSGSGAPGGTRTAPTLTNPNTADVMATNVVDFGVWLYRRDNAGNLTRVFPATARGDAAFRANSIGSVPVVADVMVRILTEEGARRVAMLEQIGAGAEEWWNVVEANSRVAVRRMAVGDPVR